MVVGPTTPDGGELWTSWCASKYYVYWLHFIIYRIAARSTSRCDHRTRSPHTHTGMKSHDDTETVAVARRESPVVFRDPHPVPVLYKHAERSLSRQKRPAGTAAAPPRGTIDTTTIRAKSARWLCGVHVPCRPSVASSPPYPPASPRQPIRIACPACTACSKRGGLYDPWPVVRRVAGTAATGTAATGTACNICFLKRRKGGDGLGIKRR